MAANAETRLTKLETRSEEFVKKSDISATLARMDGRIGELATALNYQKWILGLLVLGQLFTLLDVFLKSSKRKYRASNCLYWQSLSFQR